MSVEAIRIERERREAVAATRAGTLREGLDLYASGNYVMGRYSTQFDDMPTNKVVIECETHWDACLVVLAYGKAKCS